MSIPLLGPTINSRGELTNPDTATVLATVTLRSAGVYETLVVASASANAQFQLEHRDPKNLGNADDPAGFYCPANNPVEIRGIYKIAQGDTMRVMMNDNLTGTAFVTVYAWPVVLF